MNSSLEDRRWLFEALAFSLVWGLVSLFILLPSGSLACADSQYHIKFAEIMLERGGILKEFPWATCSIWKDSFYDKDLLFHVFLIPFTLMGKLNGAKFAVFILSCMLGFSYAILAREGGLRKNLGEVMIFVLLASGPVFLGRLVLCRPHLFSLLFMVCGMICVFRGSRVCLALVSLLYSLTYAGAWQIIPAVLIFDALKIYAEGRRPKFLQIMCIWASAGFLAGIVVNPYFPENVSGAFLQSVLVLKAKWFGSGADRIAQASELSPMSLSKFMTGYMMLSILFILSSIMFWKRRAELLSDWKLSGLFALSWIYFAATLMSMRFAEYFVPFSALAISLYWLGKTELFSVRGRMLIAMLFLFILGLVSVGRLREFFYQEGMQYAGASAWIDKNVGEGEIVFTGDWDDSPYLFYGAPKQRYLVFLEPYFMYVCSPEKYRLWNKICLGKMVRTALAIKAEFGSDVIFVPPDRPALRRKLELDPCAKLVYFGPRSETLFVTHVSEAELEEWNEAKNFLKNFKKGRGK